MTFAITVGRFQTPSIDEHPGYCYLIQEALKTKDEIVFVLGCREDQNERNILSFENRSEMISNYMSRIYPDRNFHIRSIFDVDDNNLWYSNLDKIVNEYGKDSSILIGSRDSFLDFQWNFPCTTIKLQGVGDFSSSKIRQSIMSGNLINEDLHEGARELRNKLAYTIYSYLENLRE